MEFVSGSALIIVKMAVRVTLRCKNHIVIATILDITVSSIESFSMTHTGGMVRWLKKSSMETMSRARICI